MALERILVETQTIFLDINYLCPLLLPFAFYWTGWLFLRFSDSLLKHAWNLAIESSCGRQSKDFDRSINKARPLFTLSCCFFYYCNQAVGQIKTLLKATLVLACYQNVVACDYIYILHILETGNISFFGSTRETKHKMDF